MTAPWPAYPGSAPGGHPPPRRPPTSGWAIASFALGVLSIVPLSMIFGIIAVVKTAGGRQRGRGLANGGMLISAVWVLVWVVVAAALWTEGFLVTGTVDSSPLLTVGECFKDNDNHRIGCDQPHVEEVFAILRLVHFPDTADQAKIAKRCQAELQDYSPPASRDTNVRVIVSGPGTDWKYMSNHTAGCIAHFSAPRVGSIKA